MTSSVRQLDSNQIGQNVFKVLLNVGCEFHWTDPEAVQVSRPIDLTLQQLFLDCEDNSRQAQIDKAERLARQEALRRERGRDDVHCLNVRKSYRPGLAPMPSRAKIVAALNKKFSLSISAEEFDWIYLVGDVVRLVLDRLRLKELTTLLEQRGMLTEQEQSESVNPLSIANVKSREEVFAIVGELYGELYDASSFDAVDIKVEMRRHLDSLIDADVISLHNALADIDFSLHAQSIARRVQERVPNPFL